MSDQLGQRNKMPSTSTRTKKESSAQSLTEIAEENRIVITLELAERDCEVAKRKEEAGKPLYLKRV